MRLAKMNGNAESIDKIKDYLETRIDENVKSASSCNNAEMHIAFMGQRIAFQEILDFVTSLEKHPSEENSKQENAEDKQTSDQDSILSMLSALALKRQKDIRDAKPDEHDEGVADAYGAISMLCAHLVESPGSIIDVMTELKKDGREEGLKDARDYFLSRCHEALRNGNASKVALVNMYDVLQTLSMDAVRFCNSKLTEYTINERMGHER